ncbi:30S ribosomal protein S6 [Spiroplasma citri]|uniref:Small ribosomal subunit protein bS6 n=1 Tax=Spiroplasma citri TaxID=2133 RepID=Q14QG1_SPICI|nr:30S ribosomal protein S6 [Spiroplasma citri]APE73941.1 30S ribosomal protein S6 [Spiroplasma citri]QED23971.1 30S ribosomal protein S6 [Spiroplasma citri]QIA66237.1 30S ribosomal protein S6 [Spiroplasma citri]QIA68089.1 30S ribosomal protein S6 [Spiroplasma citri]QIA69966.1 30S ribosomal protein S6 [Spiroplasma citri]
MRKYEIMYILNPEATNLDELESKLHQILEANGGKIEEHGKWGIKDLVYPIKKKTKGYYGVLIVNTTSVNIDEFVRISHIEQDVLRILVINTEKEKGYIQSTVYAKTEVKNDKPDRDRKPGNRKPDYKRHEQRSEGEETKPENAPTETKE